MIMCELLGNMAFFSAVFCKVKEYSEVHVLYIANFRRILRTDVSNFVLFWVWSAQFLVFDCTDWIIGLHKCGWTARL